MFFLCCVARRQFGVDGFLIDRIKAPSVVLDVLCEANGLQRAMYSNSDKVWNDYIEIGRNESLVEKDAGNKKHSKIAGAGFYTPNGCVRITYSVYGNQQANPSRQPYAFHHGTRITPGNSEQKQQIVSELEALKGEAGEVQEKVAVLQSEEAEARRQVDVLQGEMQRLKEQKDGTKAISARIKHAEDTLGKLQKENPGKERPKVSAHLATVST